MVPVSARKTFTFVSSSAAYFLSITNPLPENFISQILIQRSCRSSSRSICAPCAPFPGACLQVAVFVNTPSMPSRRLICNTCFWQTDSKAKPVYYLGSTFSGVNVSEIVRYATHSHIQLQLVVLVEYHTFAFQVCLCFSQRKWKQPDRLGDPVMETAPVVNDILDGYNKLYQANFCKKGRFSEICCLPGSII